MVKLKNLILVMSVLTLAFVAGLTAMFTGESSSSVTTLAPDVDEFADFFINQTDEEFENYLRAVGILPSDNTDDKGQVSKGKEIASEESEELCPICQDSILENGIKLSACNHEYHKKCIQTWMNAGQINSIKCPVCQKEMSEFKITNENLYRNSPSMFLGDSESTSEEDTDAFDLSTSPQHFAFRTRPATSSVRRERVNVPYFGIGRPNRPYYGASRPSRPYYGARQPSRSYYGRSNPYGGGLQVVPTTTRRPSIFRNIFRRTQ